MPVTVEVGRRSGEYRAQGLLRPYALQVDFIERLIDALLVPAALWAAHTLYNEAWNNQASQVAALGGIGFYLAAQVAGVYRQRRTKPLRRDVAAVAGAWAIVVTLLLLGAFVAKTTSNYSRAVMLMWAGIAPSAIIAWRLGVRLALREARSRGFNTRTVAVVGATELGHKLAARIAATPWAGLRLAGVYDDRASVRINERPLVGLTVRGGFDELVSAARAGEIDVVYITLPQRAEPRIADLLQRLSDTTASVYLAYDFYGFNPLHARWSTVGDVPVVSMVENPFQGLAGFAKRLEDVVLGSAILLLIGAPMAAIAIAVKLTSRGPVLFKQRRYGLNGEEIRVLKFRSMTTCDDGDVVVQAQAGDARVTRFGAFLRRTSLDELPQFLQVLTGTMSIVGPRPHAVAHNELYRAQIDGYMLRHKVKPGITGLAQVNGWRGETDTLDKMRKRVEYDLAYIRHLAIGLDLKIIALTVLGAVRGTNAH